MPYINSMEKSVTDGQGHESYIHVSYENDEITVFTSSPGKTSKSTWSMEEAHEILNMLYYMLD